MQLSFFFTFPLTVGIGGIAGALTAHWWHNAALACAACITTILYQITSSAHHTNLHHKTITVRSSLPKSENPGRVPNYSWHPCLPDFPRLKLGSTLKPWLWWTLSLLLSINRWDSAKQPLPDSAKTSGSNERAVQFKQEGHLLKNIAGHSLHTNDGDDCKNCFPECCSMIRTRHLECSIAHWQASALIIILVVIFGTF